MATKGGLVNHTAVAAGADDVDGRVRRGDRRALLPGRRGPDRGPAQRSLIWKAPSIPDLVHRRPTAPRADGEVAVKSK